MCLAGTCPLCADNRQFAKGIPRQELKEFPMSRFQQSKRQYFHGIVLLGWIFILAAESHAVQSPSTQTAPRSNTPEGRKRLREMARIAESAEAARREGHLDEAASELQLLIALQQEVF